MAAHGIIHRDIKPDNILLNSKKHGIYDVRIADFGFATKIDLQNADDSICGTPGYIAPEVLNKKAYQINSDIFSIGSVIFNILAQRSLFPGKDFNEVLHANKICNLSHINNQIKNFSFEG